MKREKNQQPLKEVIDKLLDQYKLTPKINELNLRKSWEQLMGKMIAKHTTDIKLKAGTLFIYLDSAVLKEELLYGKEKIKKILNEHSGKELVKDVVIR